MWSGDAGPIKSLGGPWGPEELQDLAGNMWNAFSYARVKMATVGAVDWVEVNRRKAAKQLEDEVALNKLQDLAVAFHSHEYCASTTGSKLASEMRQLALFVCPGQVLTNSLRTKAHIDALTAALQDTQSAVL